MQNPFQSSLSQWLASTLTSSSLDDEEISAQMFSHDNKQEIVRHATAEWDRLASPNRRIAEALILAESPNREALLRNSAQFDQPCMHISIIRALGSLLVFAAGAGKKGRGNHDVVGVHLQAGGESRSLRM